MHHRDMPSARSCAGCGAQIRLVGAPCPTCGHVHVPAYWDGLADAEIGRLRLRRMTFAGGGILVLLLLVFVLVAIAGAL